MKAPDLLKKAADIMEERGKQYDKPEGERSMGAAVAAFSCITGVKITEAEGLLLMQILKDVRQWQNPSSYHQDSAEDCIAYAALKAEALSEMDEARQIVNNPSSFLICEKYAMPENFGQQNVIEWPESEQRIDTIAQNGNDGEHYSSVPSWDDVEPEYKWMAQDEDGEWFAYEVEPFLDQDMWGCGHCCDYDFIRQDSPNPNWLNTLQRRPEGI